TFHYHEPTHDGVFAAGVHFPSGIERIKARVFAASFSRGTEQHGLSFIGAAADSGARGAHGGRALSSVFPSAGAVKVDGLVRRRALKNVQRAVNDACFISLFVHGIFSFVLLLDYWIDDDGKVEASEFTPAAPWRLVHRLLWFIG